MQGGSEPSSHDDLGALALGHVGGKWWRKPLKRRPCNPLNRVEAECLGGDEKIDPFAIARCHGTCGRPPHIARCKVGVVLLLQTGLENIKRSGPERSLVWGTLSSAPMQGDGGSRGPGTRCQVNSRRPMSDAESGQPLSFALPPESARCRNGCHQPSTEASKGLTWPADNTLPVAHPCPIPT